jgi:hypothetical protein
MARRGDIDIDAPTMAIWGAIVFAIAVIIVLLVLRGMHAKTPEQICQLSLQAGSATTTRTLFCVHVTDNIVPMQCGRNFITVTEDKVVKNGEEATSSYAKRCPQESQGECLAKNVVAREMQACWRQFLEGKEVPFRSMEKNTFTSVFTNAREDTACFVCSEITLRTDADVAQLKEYLEHMRLQGRNDTYFEYLKDSPYCETQYSDSNSCWERYAAKNSIDQERLIKGKTYAVTLIRHSLDTCKNDRDPGKAPTLTVQVIPADEIKKYCTGVLA